MSLSLLLEMAHDGYGNRCAVFTNDAALSYSELYQAALEGANRIGECDNDAVVYLAGNHACLPVALFAAALAGVPFVPLNFRLGAEHVGSLLSSHSKSLVVADERTKRFEGPRQWATPQSLLAELTSKRHSGSSDGPPVQLVFTGQADVDSVAVMLYTSGTTGTGKAAVLRSRHLVSYIFSTVEFGSAGDDEATLIAVPPYHIAGIANLLSNLYAGRRIMYLESFDPKIWLETVREQSITHAMVVPTMLSRLVNYLGSDDANVPSLRILSYGGSRTPISIIEAALERFGETGFVNAYGLTETSSTVALLTPEDHRAALSDYRIRQRLSSVGRPLPGIEIEIRDEGGHVLPTGEVGLVFIRGDQVSGEYDGLSTLDSTGWFATNDRGWLDDGGFLFIEGRADDVIIRGGENVDPAEIEDVLLRHPKVADVAVVGIPDVEWGQRIAAVVCPTDGELDLEDLALWSRERLRSSRTPQVIELSDELPRTASGKLMRRAIVAELLARLACKRP